MPRDYMTGGPTLRRAASRRAGLSNGRLTEDLRYCRTNRGRFARRDLAPIRDFIVKLIDVFPDDYPDPDPNPTGVRMGGYQRWFAAT